MGDYVTRSGRARPIGRVTRLSRTVGKPKGVKPLPLHMQVRPQALARLPRHPGCYTGYPASGAYVRASMTVSPAGFGLGHGLSGTGKWTLYVQADGFEPCTYRHDDAAWALGWARAAQDHGYTVTVTEA